MPGVPSNKACERCKKRHLKCDETRPHCQRCSTAGVQCPGYVQTRKFIDQGASVRRRYAPYQDGNLRPHAPRAADDIAGDPAPVHRNLDHPSNVSLRSEVAPADWQSDRMNQAEMHSPMHDLRIRSTAGPYPAGFANQVANYAPVETGPADAGLSQSRSASSRSIGPSPVPNALHEGFNQLGNVYSDSRQKPLSPNAGLAQSSPSQRSEREEFQDIFSELMTGTEHEIAFLIRHYSETLGPWLDLSDSNKFFGAFVPIRAINDPFLRFAIAALSAKHLGRMKGAVLHVGSGMFTSPATMETYPNSAQVDWFLKAANYYYLAASHMNASVSDAYTSVSSSAVLESPIEIVRRWLNLHTRQPRSQTLMEEQAATEFWKKTENLLAAATVLTLYKLLDESGDNWQSQLRGIAPLFDTILELHHQTSTHSTFSHGTAASFWNLARQDYLSSYYTRLPPHFNHQNLPLWRASGLPIDDQGNVLSSDNSPIPRLSPEDLSANSLIWLLNKVISFLADSKKSQLEQWAGQTPIPSPPAVTTTSSSSNSSTTHPTTSTWLKLQFEFQSWLERIPETFRPCLRLQHPKDLPFPEIFYSLTSCAAAMQQYHFGRLALALNRPPDAVSGPSTAFDRLQGYRELMKEADYRCKEICGIALGRPQSAARIYMVPLLYAVGQCFERAEERDIVRDLLRGVEADLGLGTGEQVRKLQTAWCQT
ncbi:C6 finger domain protein [Aspergillus steynii IBT 23096]|uniref:C6 finger domain protein n=1 Tax=Aspergillus steynii IBT 23096 TaxID=1392250 RepID=A0A2I2GAU0_9EURO|nr:C6 finger domain protein [Aspergillus steynii IBT 23096]PLB50004.1 C6 finger domain protein [Aspergillus steynii IBT 23096]